MEGDHRGGEAGNVRDELFRAGWLTALTTFVDAAGREVFLVGGTNGGDRIRAEGATQGEA